MRNVWVHGVTELREGERKRERHTHRERWRERFRKPRYFIFEQLIFKKNLKR